MRVTGDKELVANLRALGRGLPAGVIDRAATSASKPMVDDAVTKARQHRQPGRRPKGGHLDEGIVWRRKKDSTRTRRSFVLGATGRARYILHLLEWGVRSHWQPRRFGGIMHPGHRAFPIMRPAYESNKDNLETNFGRDILRQIQLMVAKMPKGGRRR